MLEIRDKEHPSSSTTIAADSEGLKVTPEASGNPVEAIEQRYASKSTMRYKNRLQIVKFMSASPNTKSQVTVSTVAPLFFSVVWVATRLYFVIFDEKHSSSTQI